MAVRRVVAFVLRSAVVGHGVHTAHALMSEAQCREQETRLKQACHGEHMPSMNADALMRHYNDISRGLLTFHESLPLQKFGNPKDVSRRFQELIQERGISRGDAKSKKKVAEEKFGEKLYAWACSPQGLEVERKARELRHWNKCVQTRDVFEREQCGGTLYKEDTKENNAARVRHETFHWVVGKNKTYWDFGVAKDVEDIISFLRTVEQPAQGVFAQPKKNKTGGGIKALQAHLAQNAKPVLAAAALAEPSSDQEVGESKVGSDSEHSTASGSTRNSSRTASEGSASDAVSDEEKNFIRRGARKN